MRARLVIVALCGGLLAGFNAWFFAEAQGPAPAAQTARLQPLVEGPTEPELAALMATLQTLTHKLALSADAGNAPLTAFYVHESLEQLKAIQREAPEYEKLPIAVLIERLALPAYPALAEAARATPAAPREVLLPAFDRIVAACNDCHAATQHGFIRITRGTEVNPFNQTFKPLAEKEQP